MRVIGYGDYNWEEDEFWFALPVAWMPAFSVEPLVINRPGHYATFGMSTIGAMTLTGEFGYSGTAMDIETAYLTLFQRLNPLDQSPRELRAMRNDGTLVGTQALMRMVSISDSEDISTYPADFVVVEPWITLSEQVATATFPPADVDMLVPLTGEFETTPTLRIQPTVQRAASTATVGFKLRRRYTITNVGTESAANFPYLINIGETATAFVTAGKALASGNDVRFTRNGLEVPRTLKGWNSASSGAWVIIPYLAAAGQPGDAITYEMLYSNPSAGTPPTLTPGDDAAIFDMAGSSNAQWDYNVARTVGDAGQGIWWPSSGTSQPEIRLNVPGAWMPATTMASDDDKRQQMYSTYEATGTKYHTRFDAKRQRKGTMTVNEINGADGVMIKVSTGITSIVTDFFFTNKAVGDTDLTPVGQLVILTRNNDNEPWRILYSNTTLFETETSIASATYTPAAAVRQVALAVWPYSGGRVSNSARLDRYALASTQSVLTLNLDSSKLVQSTAQGETAVYELATEVRYGGGGAAIGVPPYHSLYLGNAKSASGEGTPRLTLALNDHLYVDCTLRRAEIWNSTLTTKVEDVPLDTILAVDGTLDGFTGALVERIATRWMPWLPVRNPLPNPSFNLDLTGWTIVQTHANATVTRSRDAAVFSDAAGSLKVAVTASTAPTSSTIAEEINATFMPIGKRESIVVSHDVRVSSLNLVPRAGITFYNGAQTPISTAFETQADGALTAINTWERHTFAARVPKGAAYWQFRFAAVSNAVNATGNVYLDNVRVNDVDLVVHEVSRGTLVVSAAWYSRHAYA